MGIRDEEITRLIKYAQALGLKVSFISKASSHSADWVLDGSEIRIYTRKNVSKTDTILSLIHELGHHLWFIYKKERQPDLKFEEAIDRANFIQKNSKKLAPKHLRKKILTVEQEGVKYWDIIIKDTNVKISRWKVEFAKEFDIWQYEILHERGKFPLKNERIQKRKELTEKYKGKV